LFYGPFFGLSQWVYVRDDMSKGLKIMSLGVINHGMSLSVPIYIWTHPIWPLWFSFFMWWISSWGETHKFWRGPFNEYSYQVWFQFTQWFHRGRMKCKRLRTMTNRHKMMTKSHMNHWVRGKLKKERKSHICVNLLWTNYTWCIKHIDLYYFLP
jgi:hypothetical protein